MLQTVTREQGRSRHTAGAWVAKRLGSSPSSVTDMLCDIKQVASYSGSMFSHCAIKGGASTLQHSVL